MEAEKLSFQAVNKCGICESDALYLRAYVTEAGGYEYQKVVCRNCGATLTFGKVKAKKDTYFLRRKEDKKYDWQEKQAASTEKASPSQSEESLPF